MESVRPRSCNFPSLREIPMSVAIVATGKQIHCVAVKQVIQAAEVPRVQATLRSVESRTTGGVRAYVQNPR